MGLFLSLGSVIGVKTSDVAGAIKAYAEAVGKNRSPERAAPVERRSFEGKISKVTGASNSVDIMTNHEVLRNLVILAKEQGYLTYQNIDRALPEISSDEKGTQAVLLFFRTLEIDIIETSEVKSYTPWRVPHPNRYLPNNILLCPGKNGVTINYGEKFQRADDASEFVSKLLQAPVFSFYIHDDDLWGYQLYVNGVLHSKFTPKPNYFDEDGDVETFRGDVDIISRLVPGVTVASIENYLVFCTEENWEEMAYPDDHYNRSDFWQICDFMRKLGLVGPFSGYGHEDYEKDFKIVKV